MVVVSDCLVQSGWIADVELKAFASSQSPHADTLLRRGYCFFVSPWAVPLMVSCVPCPPLDGSENGDLRIESASVPAPPEWIRRRRIMART